MVALVIGVTYGGNFLPVLLSDLVPASVLVLSVLRNGVVKLGISHLGCFTMREGPVWCTAAQRWGHFLSGPPNSYRVFFSVCLNIAFLFITAVGLGNLRAWVFYLAFVPGAS